MYIKVYTYKGKDYQINGIGDITKDGAIYLSLISLTEGTMQLNGYTRKQIGGYFHYDADQLVNAKNLRDAE